ncbi:MAG TPA: hypothetical protein PKY81_14340 [bacterium]|nr:hypothetical protein [bacterium]
MSFIFKYLISIPIFIAFSLNFFLNPFFLEIYFFYKIKILRKIFNLFMCYLGFTDTFNFNQQIQALKCSILSAIYDYETDIKPINNFCFSNDLTKSLFYLLLNKYDKNPESREIALKLFKDDLIGNFQEDGLERGSQSLLFFKYLINSSFLNTYSTKQILKYGRLLQIIDDILDFKEDNKNQHLNCFLSSGKIDTYYQEIITFFDSEFYKYLSKNSPIYILIKIKCIENNVCIKKRLSYINAST